MQLARRRQIIVILLFVFCVLSVPRLRMRYAIKLEHERHRKLTADIHVARADLDRYKATKGSYPTTEEGLLVLSDRPKDPWGRDYVYRSPGVTSKSASSSPALAAWALIASTSSEPME